MQNNEWEAVNCFPFLFLDISIDLQKHKMANKLFYTYIHGTDYKNDSFVPSKMIYSYWDSLIFDVNHRTIWHQGMPFGNVYPGTLSYGEIFNDLQNNIALGAYSHAEGYSTIAKSNYSHAEGYKTFVDGVNGHVEGNSSYSLGENSHAEGSFSYSRGTNSHAEGNKSEAQGRNAHAEGFLTYAIGEDSHAEGINTYARANYSHSEGNITKIEPEAENSHAEGYNTIVSAKNAHAEGNSTKVENTGENSHAEGLKSIARAKNAHAEGNETLTAGDNAHAEGYQSKSTSTNAHAEGNNTKATGENSHAEGHNTEAKSKNSHAEGNHTIAAGENAHTEGSETSVDSPYTHAEGNNNAINTLSDSSHIEGSNNRISFSKSSHVEGDSNVNGGNIGIITNSHYSHVEGLNNKNYAINSHIEGKDTYNFGKESHIEGVEHVSYAYTSHIEGCANKIGKSVGDTKYVHVGGNNNTVYPNSENVVIYGRSNRVKGVCSDINGESINSYANYSVLRGSSLEINSNSIENNQKGIDFVNVSGNNITVGENATYSFAHGSNITLQSPYEVGLGRYTRSYLDNQKQDKQNTIFMIGNGGVNGESNALDVRENGISYLYKGIYTWDYVEDYPYSTVANNESSYCITKRQLAQVATVTYVMRNSAGRKNFYPLMNDPENSGTLKPMFTGAEYFNNYGDKETGTAPNNAYAYFCHAEGWGTYCHTGASYSHAEGCGTETRNPGEHASGNWNKSSDNTLFSVGWGTNNVNRANAFEIKSTPTSDGIAFIDKKPIVTSILNGTGPTYMWKGDYADYIKIKQVDPNTLYFIYDGDASTRNDFISIDQMDDIVNRKVEEKIKQYTQGMLYNANYSPKFNGFGGDSNFSYVWSGNTTDFAGLGSLANDVNTVFIIRNNK